MKKVMYLGMALVASVPFSFIVLRRSQRSPKPDYGDATGLILTVNGEPVIRQNRYPISVKAKLPPRHSTAPSISLLFRSTRSTGQKIAGPGVIPGSAEPCSASL